MRPRPARGDDGCCRTGALALQRSAGRQCSWWGPGQTRRPGTAIAALPLCHAAPRCCAAPFFRAAQVVEWEQELSTSMAVLQAACAEIIDGLIKELKKINKGIDT